MAKLLINKKKTNKIMEKLFNFKILISKSKFKLETQLLEVMQNSQVNNFEINFQK